MPEFLIADMRIMYRFFQDNGMIASKDEIDKTEKLLGHKPRSFDDFVKEITLEWRSKVGKTAYIKEAMPDAVLMHSAFF